MQNTHTQNITDGEPESIQSFRCGTKSSFYFRVFPLLSLKISRYSTSERATRDGHLEKILHSIPYCHDSGQ